MAHAGNLILAILLPFLLPVSRMSLSLSVDTLFLNRAEGHGHGLLVTDGDGTHGRPTVAADDRPTTAVGHQSTVVAVGVVDGTDHRHPITAVVAARGLDHRPGGDRRRRQSDRRRHSSPTASGTCGPSW